MPLAVDDLLRRWVEERAASPEPGDGEYAQFIADWLPLASSDDWHRMILGHNRALGDAPLFWIMRQKRCEKATALGIFYLARPGRLLAYGRDRAEVPETMKRAAVHQFEIENLAAELASYGTAYQIEMANNYFAKAGRPVDSAYITPL
ncbi:DUF4274 domain-containing protein [Methylosinus sp. PW1]|uniref:DUF4274 domain-containing protein n=1 Tax=Methylosinus sp. PW1 TaxID=107636 RepID=UPI00056CD0A2|nr:DUF4274 domain-containing protein [Methylosinus sp. PW1]